MLDDQKNFEPGFLARLEESADKNSGIVESFRPGRGRGAHRRSQSVPLGCGDQVGGENDPVGVDGGERVDGPVVEIKDGDIGLEEPFEEGARLDHILTKYKNSIKKSYLISLIISLQKNFEG